MNGKRFRAVQLKNPRPPRGRPGFDSRPMQLCSFTSGVLLYKNVQLGFQPHTPLCSILHISGSAVELSLPTWETRVRFPVNAGLHVLLIQKCIFLKGNLKLMRTWLEGAQLECAMKDSLIIHSLPAFQRGFANPIPSKCTISSKCCRALVVQW